jgi:hypothetical protein
MSQYQILHSIRIAALATMVAASGYAQKFPDGCAAPQYPSAKAAKIDSLCGPGGDGAGAEQVQNQAKNNFCAPGTPSAITIADMVSRQEKVQEDKSINFGNDRDHPVSAKAGPTTDRAPLVALGEGKPVVLQGFVLTARQESAESVNCGANAPKSSLSYDIHISIVDSAQNRDECSGVVVEASPHHRPATWTAGQLQSVAAAHLPVRVTGQLLFDSSHTPCQNGAAVSGDPSRASLWEVHPIYKFEVCSQGDCASGQGWTPLESWKPAKK